MTIDIREGDALAVLGTLEENSVDALLTDPPYCSGALSEAGKARAVSQGIENKRRNAWFEGDNMTTAGLAYLLREVAREAYRILKPTGHALFFMDWRMAPNLVPAIESAGLRYQNLIVWDKGSAGLAGSPEYASAAGSNVIRTGRIRNRLHPTEKPVELIRQLLEVVVPVGGLVVDPFAGSGTTGVAAKLSGRRALLIERRADFVEQCHRRVASETSQGSLLAVQ